MEPSMEHLFSLEAMVLGYYEYFRAGVKFCMGPSSFACYHHQTLNPEVCLRMPRWQKKYPKMAEEIPEDGIFSLNSPFGSGRGCLPVVLNLKCFNNTIHAGCTYAYCIAIF